MLPIVSDVPYSHNQVMEYRVNGRSVSKNLVVQVEFIDYIDYVLKVLAKPKILGGDKKEMVYNLRVLKENIETILMQNKESKKVIKLYILSPTKRCIKLVREKGFCHTQRNLMTMELNRLKNRFQQINIQNYQSF